MATPKQEMYEPPRLVVLESLDTLTLANSVGGTLDANFVSLNPPVIS